MKIEEAREVIDGIAGLAKRGRHGDLAKLRRGLSAAQSLSAYSILGQFVYPYTRTHIDAACAVCAGFASDDCRSGSVPFVSVLAGLEKEASDMRRVKRLLSCTATEEVADVLRHTMRYVLAKNHPAIDWARLLADAVNFDIAAEAVRMRWAADAVRGTGPDKEKEQ